MGSNPVILLIFLTSKARILKFFQQKETCFVIKFTFLIPPKRQFYYLSHGVSFILVSLFPEKLEKKKGYPPPTILGVLDENRQYNFRALEAKVPMVTDKNGFDFWLSQTQKHGNQCIPYILHLKPIFDNFGIPGHAMGC